MTHGRTRHRSASVLSLAAIAALLGCSVSGGPAEGATANENGTAEGGSRALHPGGTLSAPFTCSTVYGEPRPGVPLLEQLRIAAGLDVLEERKVIEPRADAGEPAPESPVRAGTPCSGAADHAACETAFEELSSGGETLRPPFDEVDFLDFNAIVHGYYLAYTKGDVVGKVSNPTELRALFPTIDTPAKALLYANAAGYRVECHHADGWIREEADKWVIVASRDHAQRCSRTDVLLWLKKDGTSEEREVVENQKDPCT